MTRNKVLTAVEHLRSCTLVFCPNCSFQTQELRKAGFDVSTIRDSVSILNKALDEIMLLPPESAY